MVANDTWDVKSSEEMNEIRRLAESKFSKVTNSVDLENTSVFFKGLADVTRLKIISLLWIEDMCMCEIVEGLNGAASTISHHLKIMERGGIIEARREGKFTIYHVNKEKLAPVMPFLAGN